MDFTSFLIYKLLLESSTKKKTGFNLFALYHKTFIGYYYKHLTSEKFTGQLRYPRV